MNLTVTLAALVAALGFAAFCGWRGARPPDLIKGPRMVPWRFLMLVSAALAVFLLVHVVNLLGYTTGDGTRLAP